MNPTKVLLIGGSGFVGGRIANRLAQQRVRVLVPTRRGEHGRALTLLPTVYSVTADVHDPQVLAGLMDGVDAVINLVGVLHDNASAKPYGKRFAAAHVDLPRRIIAAMRRTGVRRLLHMSALGAAPDAPSGYLRSKGEGEALVRAASGDLDVTIFRPSVIFGPGDSFLNTFARLLGALPVVPLAGGDARFQPVYVGDVANALVSSLGDPSTFGQSYDLCGPQVYTLRELVAYVGQLTGHRRPLITLSGALAKLQAAVLGWLPNPPMSPDNLLSLTLDSVTDGHHNPARWEPQRLEAVAPTYLCAHTLRLRLDGYRSRAGRS